MHPGHAKDRPRIEPTPQDPDRRDRWLFVGVFALLVLNLAIPSLDRQLGTWSPFARFGYDPVAWRWSQAPDVVRPFPPRRGFDDRAFEAAVRRWIPIGTPDNELRMKSAGFAPWHPQPAEPGYVHWFWSFDTDPNCVGAGYVIRLWEPHDRVLDVKAYHRVAPFCQAPREK